MVLKRNWSGSSERSIRSFSQQVENSPSCPFWIKMICVWSGHIPRICGYVFSAARDCVEPLCFFVITSHDNPDHFDSKRTRQIKSLRLFCANREKNTSRSQGAIPTVKQKRLIMKNWKLHESFLNSNICARSTCYKYSVSVLHVFSSSLTGHKRIRNTLAAAAGPSLSRIRRLAGRRWEQSTPSDRMLRHQLRHAQLPYVDGRRFRFQGDEQLLRRLRRRYSSLRHHKRHTHLHVVSQVTNKQWRRRRRMCAWTKSVARELIPILRPLSRRG